MGGNLFNSFLANVPILYPVKTPRNLYFSGVFRRYKVETLVRNDLSITLITVAETGCISLLNDILRTKFPAGIYLLKVNKRNTRIRCEICSKLKIKTPERRRSGAVIVNVEHVSHFVLVFLSLNLNM